MTPDTGALRGRVGTAGSMQALTGVDRTAISLSHHQETEDAVTQVPPSRDVRVVSHEMLASGE